MTKENETLSENSSGVDTSSNSSTVDTSSKSSKSDTSSTSSTVDTSSTSSTTPDPKNKHNKPKLRILPDALWMKILVLVELLAGVAFMVMIILMNALPSYMVAAMLGCWLALFIVSVVFMDSRKHRAMRVMGVIFAAILIIGYGIITYYLGVTYAAMQKISNDDIKSSDVDITQKAFNIYITGIDNWGQDGGIDYTGRSDVNMIVTVNPKTRKILLTSMPRDSYVRLNRTGTMDKLTHTGTYGVQETLNTVELWLGIDLDFYFKVNFTSTAAIIDAIGGVDVVSDAECDLKSCTDNSSFHVSVGTNHMDGGQALAFARERHQFEDGDFARIRHQQAVVTAAMTKLMTDKAILKKYKKILNAVTDNVETNISANNMSKLVKMQLEDMGLWTINSQLITGSTGMAVCASLDSSTEYSVVFPDQTVVDACKSNINAVMNPSEEELEQAEQAKEERQKNSSDSGQVGEITSFKDLFELIMQ